MPNHENHSARRRAINRGRFVSLLAMAAAGAGLAAPGAALAALVNYDDFSLSYIAPARWYGEEGKQFGGIRTENQRLIVNGQLRIQAKGWSDNYSDTGTSTIRNSMIIQKSSAVTAMRATVTPRTVSSGLCAGNATPTVTRGRLFGFFFNAGQPIPGSSYNDVFAGIQVYRASNSTDDAGVLRVSSFVGQCTDDSCVGSTILNSADLGTTNSGTPIALQMTWDPASNRFIFQRDSQTAVNLAYAVSDAQPASFPVKRLEVNNQIAHCTAVRPAANGIFDFDSVQTNALTGQAIVPLGAAAARSTSAPHANDVVGRVD
jgi:hypothetical protein